MIFRKALAALLAVSMSVSGIPAGMAIQSVPLQALAASTENSGTHYFYQQLTSDSKMFYQALDEMYKTGMLKKGNSDLDLVAAGYLTQEQAAQFAESGSYVLTSFGAARDAFYMEHSDIFYVDFSSMSVRVTTGADGYHIYLGTGRRDNYYTEGFTSEAQVEEYLTAYEKAVEQVAAEALAVTAEEGKNQTVEQIRYVHDYLTHHTTYRLEDACKPENIGFIRTAYGPLVTGEAVCEGYSRAFKAIMDKMGIPCVLVNGVYRHTENSLELHMWANVQVDDVWYGVDVTMDDPKSDKPTDNGVDGYENDELFMVGDSEMSKHHAASGVLSEANFAFEYPELNYDNFGETTVKFDNGLSVTYDPDVTFEGEEAGAYYVSYKGMGAAKSAEQGVYFVCNMSNYYENSDEWDTSGWMYMTPEYYPAMEDSDTELYVPLSHIQYVQFGVTDVPYGTTNYNGYEIPDFYYHGDPDLLLAASETYHNPNGYYIAPPCVEKSTPQNGRSINVGQKYHVVTTYNDKLIPVEGEDISISFTSSTGDQAVRNSTLENFEFDGDRTISFDFTPSDMWSDDGAEYTFTLSGVIGNRSHKAPYDLSFFAKNRCAVCAYRSQGYYWNLFGQPTLIDNSDISLSDWKTADGSTVSDKLTDRMVLVASTPSHAQTDTMNEMIENESEQKVLSSQTFNIDLTICNKKFISTGDGVRVQLGFPDGYGPEDEGVTFKVYHFIKNDAGAITDVEELPCTITKYGLVVLCKSFSPYAVVAVEDDGTQPESKDLIVTSSEGGTVTGADGIVSLSEGDSVTLTIEAADGYQIDAASVGSSLAEITDPKTMEITVDYADIEGTSGIVDVKFVAEAVAEKDAERGETIVPVDAEAEAVEDVPPIVVETETVKPTETQATEPETTEPAGSETTEPQVTEPTEPETTEPTPAKKLTIEDVIALSQKGEALTWDDFAEYESTDIGSGLYVLQYKIDEEFTLLIGGPDLSIAPLYIYLVKADESSIDIRTEDVEAFVNATEPETTEPETTEPETTEPETTEPTEPETTEPAVTVIPGENGEATRIICRNYLGGKDVYLLYAIDSLDYESIGYTIRSAGKSAVWENDMVYESVLIDGELYTAEALGGEYLIALRVKNVPDDAASSTTAVPILNTAVKTVAALPKRDGVTIDPPEEEIA